MAARGTLDLLARDLDSNAALMLTFIPVHHGFGRFTGELRAFSETDGHFAVEVEAGIETEDEELVEERTDNGLRVVDGSGQQVGREIHGYERREALDGRYEVHSGVVDGGTDVFAVSDPIELAVAGMLLGACAIRSLLQHQRMREMAKIYREQGRLPKFRMRSGLKGALTCDFEWEIEAGD